MNTNAFFFKCQIRLKDWVLNHSKIRLFLFKNFYWYIIITFIPGNLYLYMMYHVFYFFLCNPLPSFQPLFLLLYKALFTFYPSFIIFLFSPIKCLKIVFKLLHQRNSSCLWFISIIAAWKEECHSMHHLLLLFERNNYQLHLNLPC